jgi:hypothetical protein
VTTTANAVRWDASGTAATELGNLATSGNGFTSSAANAINDAGIAVGYVNRTSVGTHTVMWGPDGKAFDLNDLGVVANPPDGTWLLTNAMAISENGWVAGIGMFTPTDGSPYQRGWVAQLNLLRGDYNGNGIVDAADYTMWRDHLGQSYALQNRDPNASGPISQSDYDFWMSHFGQHGGIGRSRAGAGNDVAGGVRLARHHHVLAIATGRVLNTKKNKERVAELLETLESLGKARNWAMVGMWPCEKG